MSRYSLKQALEELGEKLRLPVEDYVREELVLGPSPWRESDWFKGIQQEARERDGGQEPNIPIDRVLGEYIPTEKLVRLYVDEIRDAADKLGVEFDALLHVVRYHEAGHAVTHLGRDGGGQCMTVEEFGGLDGGTNPSPLVESFAQCLCRLLCEGDSNLENAFDKLEKRQSSAYQRWGELYNWSPKLESQWQSREEVLRQMLLAARAQGHGANLERVKLAAELNAFARRLIGVCACQPKRGPPC